MGCASVAQRWAPGHRDELVHPSPAQLLWEQASGAPQKTLSLCMFDFRLGERGGGRGSRCRLEWNRNRLLQWGKSALSLWCSESSGVCVCTGREARASCCHQQIPGKTQPIVPVVARAAGWLVSPHQAVPLPPPSLGGFQAASLQRRCSEGLLPVALSTPFCWPTSYTWPAPAGQL